MHLRKALLFLTLPLIAYLGCSEGATAGGGPGDKRDPLDPNLDSGTGGTLGTLPDEIELEENFRSPVVSGPYLFSPNPETNRVARIDARSFEVKVTDGGHAPTYLAALPSTAGVPGAVVLNVLGGDASVFSEEASMGGSGSDLSELRLPVQRGASAWTVGAEGQFAIAWSRFEEDLKGPLDGYQDITVLSLKANPPASHRLSVGYRPSQVVINQDESRAFVVSEPGISVLDLSADPPSVLHELFIESGGNGASSDVSFSRDGSYAFVRLTRSQEVLIIRTEDDVRTTVSLPREVTDLDLSRDGLLAIAVMRGELTGGPGQNEGLGGQCSDCGQGGLGGAPGPGASDSQIAVFQVPEIFSAPDSYEIISTPELVGSVVIADDASRAVFYTSAVASPHLLTLDLETKEQRTANLTAPVQAAFLSADGRHAAAIMTPPTGSGKSGAFALLMTEGDLPPRYTGTASVPRFLTLSEDRVLVTTWGSEQAPAEAYLGKYPDLTLDRIELVSEPLASGIISDAGQGFVAENHPEGSVTFIDLSTSEPRTVTGFELASKVVEQ